MTITTTAGTEDNPYVNWNTTGYRLPTEGEWQYAASYKDGSTWTPYNYASGATADYINTAATGLVTVYNVSITADVGTKNANQSGIYDMSGNVWQWCWDWSGNWPVRAQSGYKGLNGCTNRIYRGGSWSSPASSCQVGSRGQGNPQVNINNIGFRVARSQ